MGNKKSFGILAEQHWASASHVARQLIGDADIAQELTQEALLQAYLSLRSLRADAHFQAWLHAIVRNVCRNYLRRQQLDDLPLELDGEVAVTPLYFHETVEPLAALEQKELSNLVEAAVAALSAKNQAAVRLFYYEQLGVQEIAKLLSASVSAIKGRLFQARRQMQAQLATMERTAEWAELSASGQKERQIAMFKIDALHAIEVKESNHYIIYLVSRAAKRLISV
ncbi:MAG: RNA polymerase sigma factor [Caldilineaceae bacterium]